jgi:hypothetical protein
VSLLSARLFTISLRGGDAKPIAFVLLTSTGIGLRRLLVSIE